MELSPTVAFVNGDVLASDADVVVQPCDCVSTRASGFVARVAARWPYAQVHSHRQPNAGSLTYATPGDVFLALPPEVTMSHIPRRVSPSTANPLLFSPATINNYTNNHTGSSNGGGGGISRRTPIVACVMSFWNINSANSASTPPPVPACPKGVDNVENRLRWFAQALRKLRAQLSKLAVHTVAFPHRLGHTHADTIMCATCTAWPRYMEAINTFAEAAPFRVAVVGRLQATLHRAGAIVPLHINLDSATVASAHPILPLSPPSQTHLKKAVAATDNHQTTSTSVETGDALEAGDASVYADVGIKDDQTLSTYGKRRRARLDDLARKKRTRLYDTSAMGVNCSGGGGGGGDSDIVITATCESAARPNEIESRHEITVLPPPLPLPLSLPPPPSFARVVRVPLFPTPPRNISASDHSVYLASPLVTSAFQSVPRFNVNVTDAIEEDVVVVTSSSAATRSGFPPFPVCASGDAVKRDKSVMWTYAEDCWMESCLASLMESAAAMCGVPLSVVHATLCTIVKFPNVAEGVRLVVQTLRDGLDVLASLSQRTLGATEARAWYLMSDEAAHKVGTDGKKKRVTPPRPRPRMIDRLLGNAAAACADKRHAIVMQQRVQTRIPLPPSAPPPSPPLMSPIPISRKDAKRKSVAVPTDHFADRKEQNTIAENDTVHVAKRTRSNATTSMSPSSSPSVALLSKIVVTPVVGNFPVAVTEATVTETKDGKRNKKKDVLQRANVAAAEDVRCREEWASFDADQRRACVAIVDDRANVFVTGKAGTGKSRVIRYVVSRLRHVHGKRVAVCAPTGHAAFQVGGVTVHKCFGLRRGDEYATPLKTVVDRLRKIRRYREQWQDVDVLVVDEISLMHAWFFERLDAVARELRHNQNPFGGIQLVLCGDFAQLAAICPPGKLPRHCFEANNWISTVTTVIQLRTVYRQQEDVPFCRLLDELRVGKCSTATLAVIKQRHQAYILLQKTWQTPDIATNLKNNVTVAATVNDTKTCPPIRADKMRSIESSEHEPARISDGCGDNIRGGGGDNTRGGGGDRSGGGENGMGSHIMRPTMLASHKVQVQEENNKRLAELEGETVCFDAIDTGRPEHKLSLSSSCNAPEQLSLKIGAQVILLRNLAQTAGLTNGSRGKVVGWRVQGRVPGSTKHQDAKLPIVLFETGRRMVIERLPHPLCIEETEVASRLQLPLNLAWAITIHNSQGMTLTSVAVSLAKCFTAGQSYVAFSRVRSLSGLYVVGFDAKRATADEKVRKFYDNLPPPPPPSSPPPPQHLPSLLPSTLSLSPSTSSPPPPPPPQSASSPPPPPPTSSVSLSPAKVMAADTSSRVSACSVAIKPTTRLQQSSDIDLRTLSSSSSSSSSLSAGRHVDSSAVSTNAVKPIPPSASQKSAATSPVFTSDPMPDRSEEPTEPLEAAPKTWRLILHHVDPVPSLPFHSTVCSDNPFGTAVLPKRKSTVGPIATIPPTANADPIVSSDTLDVLFELIDTQQPNEAILKVSEVPFSPSSVSVIANKTKVPARKCPAPTIRSRPPLIRETNVADTLKVTSSVAVRVVTGPRAMATGSIVKPKLQAPVRPRGIMNIVSVAHATARKATPNETPRILPLPLPPSPTTSRRMSSELLVHPPGMTFQKLPVPIAARISGHVTSTSSLATKRQRAMSAVATVVRNDGATAAFLREALGDSECTEQEDTSVGQDTLSKARRANVSLEPVVSRAPENPQPRRGKLFRKFASIYPTANLYLEPPAVATATPVPVASSSTSPAIVFAAAHPWKSRIRKS
jgi:ATP-dependent DNA helicase PIF1